MSVFSKRLRQARKQARLSQEALGVLVGIEEASARGRVSHYELERHEPDFKAIHRFANALDVPESFFFEFDDDIAEALLRLHQMPIAKRDEALKLIKDLADNK